MVVTVSPTDPRAVKALEILADAGQWLKCRTPDGGKYFGVRSQANPNVVYFTDCHGCTCPDFTRRQEHGRPGPCKHMLAVQLHCARVNGRRAQLQQARQRRRLQQSQSEACGICNIPHRCHCPRLMSACQACEPPKEDAGNTTAA